MRDFDKLTQRGKVDYVLAFFDVAVAPPVEVRTRAYTILSAGKGQLNEAVEEVAKEHPKALIVGLRQRKAFVLWPEKA